jgi:ketosteroid isomerase-like protein
MMSGAEDVVKGMCSAYSSAVNASDSAAYTKLFTEDAIRMPPGAIPEYGQEEIRRGEQADYDEARWTVSFAPRDALLITEGWIYAIADVDGSVVAHADGESSSFRLTVTWLLSRQPSGEWLIKRQMWNRKPDQS